MLQETRSLSNDPAAEVGSSPIGSISWLLICMKHRRARGYCGFILIISAAFLLTSNQPAYGSILSHTVLAAITVPLAASIAVMALIRFDSRKSNTMLIIGIGFLGSTFLDAHHAYSISELMSGAGHDHGLFSASWSGIASRFLLSITLLMSTLAPIRLDRGALADFAPAKRPLIMMGVASFTVALTILALPALITSYYFVTLQKSASLVVGLVFLFATVVCLRKCQWKRDAFEHWLVLSLIAAFFGEGFFMTISSQPFDTDFMAGHLLKFLSYAFVLIGLFYHMYVVLQQSEMNAARSRRSSDALRAEVRERSRAERILARQARVLDEKSATLEAILENMDQGVSLFDSDLRAVVLNRRFYELLGFDRSDIAASALLKGFATSNVFNSAFAIDEIDAQAKYLFEKDHPTGPEKYERQNASGQVIEVNRKPMPSGGFICTYSDITERKNIERIKDEFISTVNHELRTPMTSILGSLALMDSGQLDSNPAQLRRMIEIAHGNSKRLIRLINDILDIEKIESGRTGFVLKPILLSDLVRKAVTEIEVFGRQHHVTFAFNDEEPGATVVADEDRLMQVLVNFLSNAAKFTVEGDEIEIAALRMGQSIRVSVTDHGPGIAESFQPSVFKKFTQADASDARQKGGSGLGLSICRAIVENLGGQIGFTTAPDTGTSFYFDLPESIEHAECPNLPVAL